MDSAVVGLKEKGQAGTQPALKTPYFLKSVVTDLVVENMDRREAGSLVAKWNEASGTSTKQRLLHGRQGAQGPGHAAEARSVLTAGWETRRAGVHPQQAPGLEQREGGDRHSGTGCGAQCWWSWGLCKLC